MYPPMNGIHKSSRASTPCAISPQTMHAIIITSPRKRGGRDHRCPFCWRDNITRLGSPTKEAVYQTVASRTVWPDAPLERILSFIIAIGLSTSAPTVAIAPAGTPAFMPPIVPDSHALPRFIVSIHAPFRERRPTYSPERTPPLTSFSNQPTDTTTNQYPGNSIPPTCDILPASRLRSCSPVDSYCAGPSP